MAKENEISAALDLLTGSPVDAKARSAALKAAPPAIDASWMYGDGVCALGLAERVTAGRKLEELALKVYVERKLPLARCEHPVPEKVRLEGLPPIPIDVEEIGKIELHAASMPQRPAQPGMSISLAEDLRWVGTFGLVAVKCGHTQPQYLVSSSHVIADSGLANVGAAIVQPSAAAGGDAATDTIAHLTQWVPFTFSDTGFENTVDAAIAELVPDIASAAILEIGLPTGVSADLARGMVVQKVGGETGHSIAEIRDIHLRLPSYYPTAGGQVQRAGFTDQVLTSFYAGQGDSSAPVLNMKGEVVGVQFAGSVSASIFSKIGNVLSALDLELITTSSRGEDSTDASASSATVADVRMAIDQHQNTLSALPNVVGMGVVPTGGAARGGQAAAVYVKRKVALEQLEATQRVPAQLPIERGSQGKNVPTKVIEVGDIKPHILGAPDTDAES